MKKAATTAKTAAKTTVLNVVKVPQHIGRTILSVPKTITKIANKNNKNSHDNNDNNEERLKFADTLEFISKEILEDQGRRKIVRDSQSECMMEISNHLKAFLWNHPDDNATYEEWIASVHPDNVQYVDNVDNVNNEDGNGDGNGNDGSTSRGTDTGRYICIDHRFYVEESDHRILWNECMKKLDWTPKRFVEVRSVDPNYKNRLQNGTEEAATAETTATTAETTATTATAEITR
jgi:hypothetical protein